MATWSKRDDDEPMMFLAVMVDESTSYVFQSRAGQARTARGPSHSIEVHCPTWSQNDWKYS